MSLGMRCGDVVGVARFADAQQQHIVAIQSVGDSFEQRKSGGLANRDSIARGVERTTRQRGAQLQRVKPVQGGQAQGVHAAHDRGVDHIRFDHAARGSEHLGAGGAGTGHGHGGAFQVQPPAQKIGPDEFAERGVVLSITAAAT